MKRRLIIDICIVILLIIIVPVGIKQVAGEESRDFKVVKLEDTVYKELSFQTSFKTLDSGACYLFRMVQVHFQPQ